MSVVALAGLKGAPGVTTAALGLGAVWPRPVTIVEADADGGDVVAWYRLGEDPGLASLMTEARRGLEPGPERRHGRALPGGLRVVTCPLIPAQVSVALSLPPGLMAALRSMTGADVLVDCGRLVPGGRAVEIAREADAVVVLAWPSVADLRRLVGVIAALGSGPTVVAMVRGEGPYRVAEIEAVLGVPVVATLPHDPRAAAVVNGGSGSDRRLRLSPLVAALRDVADHVCAGLPQLHEDDTPALRAPVEEVGAFS